MASVGSLRMCMVSISALAVAAPSNEILRSSTSRRSISAVCASNAHVGPSPTRGGSKSTLTARLPALRLAHARGVAAAAAASKSRILSVASAISAASAPRCSRSAASCCWRQRSDAPCASARAAA
eukprot:1713678-Pleurochrysis_carterae.AAC.1